MSDKFFTLSKQKKLEYKKDFSDGDCLQTILRKKWDVGNSLLFQFLKIQKLPCPG